MQTPQEDYPRDMVQREEVQHQGGNMVVAAIKKPVRIFIGFFAFIMCAVFAFALFGPATGSQVKNVAENKELIKAVAAVPVESELEYKSKCNRIGGEKNRLGLKEFLKNPFNFSGQRISLIGKIMFIEEKDGLTTLQMYVDSKYNTVVVYFKGAKKVYEDDIITVSGEGAGTYSGTNRMGAQMSWPMVSAKYIDLKHRD